MGRTNVVYRGAAGRADAHDPDVVSSTDREGIGASAGGTPEVGAVGRDGTAAGGVRIVAGGGAGGEGDGVERDGVADRGAEVEVEAGADGTGGLRGAAGVEAVDEAVAVVIEGVVADLHDHAGGQRGAAAVGAVEEGVAVVVEAVGADLGGAGVDGDTGVVAVGRGGDIAGGCSARSGRDGAAAGAIAVAVTVPGGCADHALVDAAVAVVVEAIAALERVAGGLVAGERCGGAGDATLCAEVEVGAVTAGPDGNLVAAVEGAGIAVVVETIAALFEAGTDGGAVVVTIGIVGNGEVAFRAAGERVARACARTITVGVAVVSNGINREVIDGAVAVVVEAIAAFGIGCDATLAGAPDTGHAGLRAELAAAFGETARRGVAVDAGAARVGRAIAVVVESVAALGRTDEDLVVVVVAVGRDAGGGTASSIAVEVFAGGAGAGVWDAETAGATCDVGRIEAGVVGGA